MDTTTSYFKVSSKTLNHAYYASVKEGNLISFVNFGATKCMQMTVFKNWKDDSDSFYAHIQGLSFNSFCAVGNALPKGVGTIDMVRTGLAFVATLYPWLKGVKFVDSSHVECLVEGEFEDLNLNSLELAKYGQTWYTKHFFAQPDRAVDRAKLQTVLPNLDNIFQTHKGDYEKFYRTYIKRLGVNESVTSNKELEKTFNKSSSFQSWILRVLRHKTLGCSALIDWLNRFVCTVLKLDMNNMLWKISFNDLKRNRAAIQIEKIEYAMLSDTRKSMLGGKMKFSRKVPKQKL